MNEFSIELSRTAEKDLDSLDNQICEKIIKKFQKIKAEPIRFIERLVGYTLYKLRCGEYRAIVRVDTSKSVLQILMIDHRKDIYKRLQKLIL